MPSVFQNVQCTLYCVQINSSISLLNALLWLTCRILKCFAKAVNVRCDRSTPQIEVFLNERSASSVLCRLPTPGLRGPSQSRGSWVKPFCATAAFNEPWGSAPSEHFDRCQGLNLPFWTQADCALTFSILSVHPPPPFVGLLSDFIKNVIIHSLTFLKH